MILQRGYPWDAQSQTLPRDGGNQTLISSTDAFGNDESFFMPPVASDSIESPVWSPTANALYFSDKQGVTHGSDLPHRGLKRFEPTTGRVTELWFQEDPPDCVAISPDGSGLVATNGALHLYDGLLGPSVGHRQISSPAGTGSVPSATRVAWGPSRDILVGFFELLDPATAKVKYHLERYAPDGTRTDAHFIDDADRPVALGDGAVVYWHGGNDIAEPAVRLREPDGSTRDLMAGDVYPVSYDRSRNALTYRLEADLHWRDLTSGLDLVIVQSMSSGSVKGRDPAATAEPAPSP